MDTKKSSSRSPKGTYIPPHRRHYPRTESVHYQSAQKKAKSPKSRDSNDKSPRSASKPDPIAITPPAVSPTRRSPSHSTRLPTAQVPTSAQVEFPTTDELEAFYATSYTQPSPVDY